MSPEWIADSTRWRGRPLVGEWAHWCDEWDGLPIDETCPEWPCGCAFADGSVCAHWGEPLSHNPHNVGSTPYHRWRLTWLLTRSKINGESNDQHRE